MMSCEQIRERLLSGAPVDGDDVTRHASSCPACHELVAADGALGQVLGRAPAGSSPDLGALYARLEADLGRERGPLAWLRSRATWIRLAIAAASFVAASGLTLWMFPRADLPVFPAGRMLLTIGLYAGLGLALVAVALRSLHRPPVRHRTALVAAALVAVPLGLCLLPAAHLDHPASIMGDGPMLAAKAKPCLTFGLSASIVPLAALLLLERSGQRGSGRWLAAAAGAGLAGSMAVHFLCPITLPVHLLAGHAAVPLLAVILGGVLAGLVSAAARLRQMMSSPV